MQRRPELSVVHNHSLCHPERSGIIRLRMIHEVEGPMHLYLRAQARGVAIQACLWLEWVKWPIARLWLEWDEWPIAHFWL